VPARSRRRAGAIIAAQGKTNMSSTTQQRQAEVAAFEAQLRATAASATARAAALTNGAVSGYITSGYPGLPAGASLASVAAEAADLAEVARVSTARADALAAALAAL
jgi:hypothetical protein